MRNNLGGLRSPLRRAKGPLIASGITNTRLPQILGLLSKDSLREFDVGIFSGPVTGYYDVRIRQTTPTATPLPRQSSTGLTTGSYPEVQGSSLILDVWALDGLGGEVLVSSLPFGPLTAAAEAHIAGLVVNASGAFNPDPAGYPYDMNLLAVNPATTPYAASPGYGYVGSIASTTGHGTTNKGSGTPLLKGFHNFTGTMSQTSIRIDVVPGVYRLHCALGGASTKTPKMRVRDGSMTGPMLMEINYVALLTTDATTVMDATGTVLSGDAWLAASAAGGTGVQFTVTGNAIFIGPDASGTSDNLQVLNLIRVS